VWTLRIFGLILGLVGILNSSPAVASATTILRGQLADPASLNIGLICQWEEDCIYEHKTAMRKALKYVSKYKPAQWRIEQCNRNASRGSARVDWIGFNQCIRNASLRYVPPPAKKSAASRKARRK
jgi:hypothetical protein